jgi:hypothetical protein
MAPAVLKDHFFVSSCAWFGVIVVSALTPSREISCKDVGQLSVVAAVAVWGASKKLA